MKTLLITGGGGMVGKNLLEYAEKANYRTLAPSSRELDLLDYEAVLRYLSETQPDYIVHAAGKVGGIQANMREPISFFLNNMDMGRNIVWAAKNAGVKRLLNLGSSCMYPKDAPNPLREEMVLRGQLEPTNEGYALAKIATARLCDYIGMEEPEYQYKTIVPCNLYGKWDKFSPQHSHLIPAVIRKIHEAQVQGSESVEIWGDGLARREFMYSEDLADCIVHVLDHFDDMPSLMNVGLGYDHTINEYYEAVARVVGYEGKFEHDLSKPVGMKQKLVDISRQTEFGWKPRFSLDQGIRLTYEHFLSREDHK
ncbi:GDP-fucose synthetase [Saccharibacillus sp. O16]|nr:GDP-fucose synthetase [Saccharibacillus sp. O16]